MSFKNNFHLTFQTELQTDFQVRQLVRIEEREDTIEAAEEHDNILLGKSEFSTDDEDNET